MWKHYEIVDSIVFHLKWWTTRWQMYVFITIFSLMCKVYHILSSLSLHSKPSIVCCFLMLCYFFWFCLFWDHSIFFFVAEAVKNCRTVRKIHVMNGFGFQFSYNSFWLDRDLSFSYSLKLKQSFEKIFLSFHSKWLSSESQNNACKLYKCKLCLIHANALWLPVNAFFTINYTFI